MSVSHEAIYTWIYAQPKGELARAGIVLRTGREQRKPRGRKKSTGAKIVGMRSIGERPAEAAGRQVPGHWEGDLVIGKAGKSAMGTLVERVSRFLCPVALPDGHDADSVKDALFDAVKDLPAHLRKSLTWDQGTEMARHAALTVAADLPIYFAHAHSPWERGTNENTNGLIREYWLFELNRDGVSGWLPGVFSWRLRCVMGAVCHGCRRCGRACAGSRGCGNRRRGALRAWRAGSGSRRWRS